MTPPASDKDRLLGDYRLKRLVLETPLAYRWLAEQVSVGRMVLVDELKPELMSQREVFLANVRAKAAMKHPLVASVYEAVDVEGSCFFAHEYLAGGTLESRVEAGAPMKPTELAHVLRRVAEVCQQYEQAGQSTLPMSLEHLHYDGHGVLQLDNLIKAGERSPQERTRDMGYLGRTLLPLVADGQPGTTRLQTLLRWMRGEVLEEPLTWSQVGDLCELIEKQLSDPEAFRPSGQPAPKRGGVPLLLVVLAGVLALSVLLLVALRMRPARSNEQAPERVELPAAVAVPAATVVMADGSQADVAGFQIQAHEVTIGEYAQFLKALEALQAHGRERGFDHPQQPSEKASHLPDDWQAMVLAAQSGGSWHDRRITMDTPVVGVDWWDAWAYADWNDGRLPTEAEWMAALGQPPEQAAKIPAAGWEVVDASTADRSAHGVLYLAGSVSEWLAEPSASPADPRGEKQWVLAGGSYLQQGSHAMTREWVPDRSLRRADMGFRVVHVGK